MQRAASAQVKFILEGLHQHRLSLSSKYYAIKK